MQYWLKFGYFYNFSALRFRRENSNLATFKHVVISINRFRTENPNLASFLRPILKDLGAKIQIWQLLNMQYFESNLGAKIQGFFSTINNDRFRRENSNLDTFTTAVLWDLGAKIQTWLFQTCSTDRFKHENSNLATFIHAILTYLGTKIFSEQN